MKKPVEIAIIAALKAAGPRHRFVEEAKRRSCAITAARDVLGTVPKATQAEIMAALETAWALSNVRQLSRFAAPSPTLRDRVAQAQRMLCDAHLLRSGDTIADTRTLWHGRTLASLLTEAREFLAAKAAARAAFEAKRTSEIARVRGVLSTLSPVVLDAWQHCGYRAPSERWCDRAGESVAVGLVDEAVCELLVGTHPENAQLVRVNVGAYSGTDKVWDLKGKLRSGTSSSHRLYVRDTWVRDVAHRTLAVVDNMLTLDAKLCFGQGLTPEVFVDAPPSAGALAARLGATVYQAVWIEQSLGLTVKAIHGYIAAAQTGNGVVAVHGATPMGALRTLQRRIRPDEVAQRREELDAKKSRKTAVEQQRDAAFQAFCNEMHFSFDLHVLANLLPVCYAIAAGALDAEITLGDSTPKTSGNCVSGTRDWVARHLPGRTKATVSEVAQAALQSGDRTDLALRACRFAVLRWAASQSRANRKAA